MTQEVHIGVSR